MKTEVVDNKEIKKKIAEEELFRLSRLKEEIRRTEPHNHDIYYELIFLQKGQGLHWIDKEKFKI